MGERTLNKAGRLLRIEQLLLAHPDGLTQAQLARRLGVHRSTISRDLADLDPHLALYETGDGRLAIDRDSYLTAVRFSLHEALAAHRTDRRQACHRRDQLL